MPDREKVILGLQAIYDEAYDRWVHTQYGGDRLVTLVSDVVPDALVLLREQEPVESFHVCINGKRLRTLISNKNYVFCPYCGRRIKWDA